MRINCPFCGERDLQEFVYQSDANAYGPSVPAEGPVSDEVRDRAADAVYFLDNPAGPHEGLWYHRWGCRSWLRVRRDTRTHAILSVALAREASAR
jgi:heterotetrameric sarcosine oxidase delta subunit